MHNAVSLRPYKGKYNHVLTETLYSACLQFHYVLGHIAI